MRVKRRNDPNVRAFWTRYVALWMRSAFSQPEYCARNGISRTLMSKWWIWLREDGAREERIKIGRCCDGHRRSTMTNEFGHRTNDLKSLSPAAVLKERVDRPVVRRRRFTEEEKRHFSRPGRPVRFVVLGCCATLQYRAQPTVPLAQGVRPRSRCVRWIHAGRFYG